MPLLVAIRERRYEVAGLLIRLNADCNLCDQLKDSPLTLSCACGQLALVQLLVNHGAAMDHLCNYRPANPHCNGNRPNSWLDDENINKLHTQTLNECMAYLPTFG